MASEPAEQSETKPRNERNVAEEEGGWRPATVLSHGAGRPKGRDERKIKRDVKSDTLYV